MTPGFLESTNVVGTDADTNMDNNRYLENNDK